MCLNTAKNSILTACSHTPHTIHSAIQHILYRQSFESVLIHNSSWMAIVFAVSLQLGTFFYYEVGKNAAKKERNIQTNSHPPQTRTLSFQ